MATHRWLLQAGLRIRGLHGRLRREIARQRELRRYRTVGRALAARRGEADHLVALQCECARSREADRSDRAAVEVWMLPMVELRGLVTRAVLRHRIARGHRDLRKRYEELGRGVPTGSGRPEDVSTPTPAAQPAALREQAGTEAARFGLAFWGQLRPAILPRTPALAGLAAGWWIANTYTDSRLKSLARSIGIGSGGTTVVSGETYRAMSFWLPLVAAALCAYLGDRLAAAWRAEGSGE